MASLKVRLSATALSSAEWVTHLQWRALLTADSCAQIIHCGSSRTARHPLTWVVKTSLAALWIRGSNPSSGDILNSDETHWLMSKGQTLYSSVTPYFIPLVHIMLSVSASGEFNEHCIHPPPVLFLFTLLCRT